jgi:hypothetical protein
MRSPLVDGSVQTLLSAPSRKSVVWWFSRHAFKPLMLLELGFFEL